MVSETRARETPECHVNFANDEAFRFWKSRLFVLTNLK